MADDRYTDLVRRLKAESVTPERERELRQEMAEIEARAFPSELSYSCKAPETADHRHHRYARCKSQRYCGLDFAPQEELL